MNTTEHIYEVYTQNGMMLNRVDFKDKINDYGEPIATSSNGINFVFQRSIKTIQENYSQKLALNILGRTRID